MRYRDGAPSVLFVCVDFPCVALNDVAMRVSRAAANRLAAMAAEDDVVTASSIGWMYSRAYR